jgi:TctA family transporter
MAEKRLSRTPERFGRGAIEGVASPEAANNASAQTSFIPLLTLGIPSNAIIALMFGAMIMQGIQPGPDVIVKRPDLFWGLVASMVIGNIMLVIINLPLVGVWVKLLKIPYYILFPSIVVFCCVGAYTVSDTTTDLLILAGFGFAGIVLTALNFQFIPLLLGFILGPLAEENLRRAMAIAKGDPMVFLNRPISLVLLILTAGLLVMALLPKFQARKVEFVD